MRSVSPYRYSSATRSPITAMRAPSKRSRSERRSALRCMEAVSLTNSSAAASSARGRRQPFRRARLPPAVHPEPVVGMRADRPFDRAGQFLREHLDGGAATRPGRRRERALETHPVRAVGAAHREGGQQGGSRAQREDGGGGRGAGGLAKEIDEDAARRAHVLIDHHGQRLAAPEQPQRRAGGPFVGQLAQPSLAARREEALVEAPPQRPRDGGDLHPAPRRGAPNQLPVAEVRDRHHHSAAPGAGGLEAIPVLEAHQRLELGVADGARERDLQQAAAELAVGGAPHGPALLLGALRKSSAQALERDPPAQPERPRGAAQGLAEREQEPRPAAAYRNSSSRAASSAPSPARMRRSTGTDAIGGGPVRSDGASRTESFSVVTRISAPARCAARRSCSRSRAE